MKGLSFDLVSLRAAYDKGLDPQALVDLVFDRIAAAEDPGIFITLRPREDVHADVAALGPRDRPLWGVPFAVKDNIDVAGLPTTAACPDFACTAEVDATAVARLRAAGALVIGKTNLDQFATGLVGLRTPYPAPRNSFDPAIVPGGSSSGSAVAVARGLVSFALGTDTAGSGRVPAALNNIVGLKPTLGAVSTRGVVPACRTLDCVSVFALTTPDAWEIHAMMAGFDAADALSRDIALGSPSGGVKGLRIGAPDAASRKFGGDSLAEARLRCAPRSLAHAGRDDRRHFARTVLRDGAASLRRAVGRRTPCSRAGISRACAAIHAAGHARHCGRRAQIFGDGRLRRHVSARRSAARDIVGLVRD